MQCVWSRAMPWWSRAMPLWNSLALIRQDHSIIVCPGFWAYGLAVSDCIGALALIFCILISGQRTCSCTRIFCRGKARLALGGASPTPTIMSAAPRMTATYDSFLESASLRHGGLKKGIPKSLTTKALRHQVILLSDFPLCLSGKNLLSFAIFASFALKTVLPDGHAFSLFGSARAWPLTRLSALSHLVLL